MLNSKTSGKEAEQQLACLISQREKDVTTLYRKYHSERDGIDKAYVQQVYVESGFNFSTTEKRVSDLKHDKDMELLCKLYDIDCSKAETAYIKDPQTFDVVLKNCRKIIAQTPPEVLAEVTAVGYYTISIDYKFSLSFKGRIGRLEYWATIGLFWIGLFIVLFGLGNIIGVVMIGLLFWLRVAQATKRCHDIGKAGTYQYHLFRLLFAPSNGQLNRYGIRY